MKTFKKIGSFLCFLAAIITTVSLEYAIWCLNKGPGYAFIHKTYVASTHSDKALVSAVILSLLALVIGIFISMLGFDLLK